MMTQLPICDPNEAPIGFYAVPKAEARIGDGNICRQCDWRKQCCDQATDLLAHGHRCMAAPLIAERDGKTYQRRDGVSVVFKSRLGILKNDGIS